MNALNLVAKVRIFSDKYKKNFSSPIFFVSLHFYRSKVRRWKVCVFEIVRN